MATVDKNFRVKNGLVVEGSTATVNNSNIVTEAYVGASSDLELSAGKLILSAGVVGETELASNAVTEAKIASSAVTEGKIASSAVTEAKIASNAVTNAKLADDAVDTAEIKDGAVTNAKLAGSIANDKLTNSAITINGTSVSLGGTRTLGTDDISEGSTNKYFTDERAQDAIGALIAAGTQTNITVEYDDAGGKLNFNASGGVSSLTGTANEVEVSASTGAVTIGLPDNVTIGNNLTVTGDLTVNGTTTTINSTTLSVDDKNIELASTASPTDASADGAGITVKGTTDKTWNWVDATDSWTSSEHINLASGKEYKVNGTSLKDVTETLTNKTISGSNNTITNIGNGSLTNSAITINGTSVSLGGTRTLGTDDVAEGSNNKYFTDARAVTALEAVVPDFTAVEVNNIAKQVAATASLTTTNETTAYSWAKADYRAAKFLVKFAYGTHTEVSEVLLTLDTSDNVGITEYAIVSTNGSLGSVTADVSGSDVRLRVTAGTATTTCHVVGTLVR
jgi:hypothetical protein